MKLSLLSSDQVHHKTLIVAGGVVDGADGGHDVGDGVQVAGDVKLEHRGQELAQILLKKNHFYQMQKPKFESD